MAEKLKEVQKELLSLERQRKKLTDEIIELQKEELEDATKLLEIQKQEAKVVLESRKLQLEEARLKGEQTEAAEEAVEYAQKQYDIAKQNLKVEQEKRKELDKQKEAYKEIKDLVGDILKTTLGITREATRTEKMLAQGGAGLKIFAKELKDSLLSKEGILNISRSIRGKLIESTIAFNTILDQSYAKISALTGAGREFDSTISEAAYGLKAAGATISGVTEAFGPLAEGMVNFINLSEDQRVSVLQSAAMLERLGVDAGTTATNMELLTRVFGDSVDEALQFNEELVQSARAMGRPVALLAKDFAQLGPQLAQFGSEAKRVFMDLERLARQTGTEADALLRMSDNLDNFTNAAQASNAFTVMFGKSISALDLVMAEPAEKVNMFKDALDSTGLAFDDLNRFQKKFLAEQLGLEVAEAQKILSKNPAVVDKNAESLQAMAEAATDLTKNLLSIAESIAITFQPALSLVKEITAGIASFVSESGTLIRVLLGIAAVAGPVWIFFSGLPALGAAVAGGMAAAGGGVAAFGTAAAVGAPGILAFAGAVALIGAGVGVAAWGLSFLVESFSKLEPEGILGSAMSVGAFTTALIGLTAIAPFAIPALAALALGFAGLSFAAQGTQGLATLLENAAALSAVKIKSIVELAQAAKSYNESTSKAAESSAMSDLVKAVEKVSSGGASSPTVQVFIDGKEIKNAVVRVFGDAAGGIIPRR